jgi:hypothetical protein
MSRKPRAPISLRVLGREPSVQAEVAIEPGETLRLPDPEPERRVVAIAPPVASATAGLVGDIPRTPQLRLAPAVDVVPATLVGTTFALRRVALRLGPAVSEVTTLLAVEAGEVPVLQVGPSQRAEPTAAVVRRVEPLPVSSIPRDVLHDCLERLFHASGASATDDLSLVGVYDRVPIGAIAGAQTTPRGLQLRLQPGARATPGLLVVGRRRSSGALVTVEVPAAASPE